MRAGAEGIMTPDLANVSHNRWKSSRRLIF